MTGRRWRTDPSRRIRFMVRSRTGRTAELDCQLAEAAHGVLQEGTFAICTPRSDTRSRRRTSLSPDVLAATEERLGVKVPTVLRDYYLVAGRERRFRACHNRLLPPTEWAIDKKRLIFMEENQSVVWWGVSIRNPDTDDPPVSQGINDEPITWSPEHRKCSVFLAVMLHYQAVAGGFRFCGWGNAPEPSGYCFEEQGWTCYGEINSQRAYSRPNQVVCVMPPGDLPFMQSWSVLAGGKTKRDLQAIGAELGIAIK